MIAVGFLILASCPRRPGRAADHGHRPWGCPVVPGDDADPGRALGVLTPALLSLLLPWVAPANACAWTTGGSSGTSLITQLLPLALGLGFRQAAPGWARRLEKPVGLLANVLLLALVGAIVVTQFGMLAAIRFRGWFGMGLLLMASLGLGWSCGGPDGGVGGPWPRPRPRATWRWAWSSSGATSRTAPAVTAVVACGLVSILGALGFALLLGRFDAIGTERVAPLRRVE